MASTAASEPDRSASIRTPPLEPATNLWCYRVIGSIAPPFAHGFLAADPSKKFVLRFDQVQLPRSRGDLGNRSSVPVSAASVEGDRGWSTAATTANRKRSEIDFNLAKTTCLTTKELFVPPWI
ncbi:MAG: hypothetical protein OXH38_02125, partial [Chloroflexi bacterium]|nr:hypothetical protein [Chloroflexota bacterium]